MFRNDIPDDYMRMCNYNDLMHPGAMTIADTERLLHAKQERLEELCRNNKEYPSEYAEKQIARVKSIIENLQETIAREKSRGKKR